MNDVMPGAKPCIVCSAQKYGPGNGFCFDCHNRAVGILKLVNRKKFTKAEGMQILMEGGDGQVHEV